MRLGTADRCVRLALLITLSVVVLVLGLGSLGASSGTTVVVSSSTVSAAGETGVTNVSVTLAPQDSLSEFEVHIAYDAALLDVVDADAIVMNARWDPPTGLPLLIDASDPGVVVVHASTGDPCPVGASCPLFSFTWEALANGTTAVSVTMQSLVGTQSGAAGALTGVTVSGGNVTVGSQPVPSPSATSTTVPTGTATSVPTASPTATATAGASPTSPTTVASPTIAVPGTTVEPAATQSGLDDTTAVPPASAPSSGSGLQQGGGAGLAQAAMAAFFVAALLAFGWIMTTLRGGDMQVAAATVGPPHRSRAELEMDLIVDYLQTMEALGMASSDIETDAGPQRKPTPRVDGR